MSPKKLAQTTSISIFILVTVFYVYQTVSFKRWEGIIIELEQGYSPINWSDSRVGIVQKWLSSPPNSCNWRDRQIISKLELALLDRVVASPVTYQMKSNAFAKNIDFSKETAACNPLRHQNWIMLARLESIMIFDKGRISDILSFTRALAPTQLAGLSRRIEAYTIMPGIDYLLQFDPVQKDFIAMLRYGRNGTLVSSLKRLQERGADFSFLYEQADLAQQRWLQSRGFNE